MTEEPDLVTAEALKSQHLLYNLRGDTRKYNREWMGLPGSSKEGSDQVTGVSIKADIWCGFVSIQVVVTL